MIGSFSFLQATRTTIKAWMSSNFGGILPLTSELAALSRLKNRNNKLVSSLAPSCLIGSSSFLQVTRTTIKSRMSLKFGRTQPWTVALAALDQFKKSLNLLLENYSKYFDDLLSGQRSLPFGLLVVSPCGF